MKLRISTRRCAVIEFIKLIKSINQMNQLKLMNELMIELK